MFKNDFLEGLSKIHFSVPLFIFVPAIVFFIYKAILNNISVTAFAGYFILGIFVWTAAEYVLHRYLFHYMPKSEWGLRLHFIFHGVHHDYPRDSKRLVMVPSVSVPLAALFYFLFSLFLAPVNLYAFFPGFIIGYLAYDMTHYAIHHANFKSSFWKKIKQHHMLHHYDDPSKGYGVSSVLWDKILDSDFPKKK
jgi:sterol desaturase/sphingolipid hydroxylase (fatty acid hydroxylase superfamily)